MFFKITGCVCVDLQQIMLNEVDCQLILYLKKKNCLGMTFKKHLIIKN